DGQGNLIEAVTYTADGKVLLKDNAGAGTALGNVAAGKIASGSRDAINGGQLFSIHESIANALGGGSRVDANGKVIAPNYHVGGITVNSVGAAISNVDGRVNNLESQISGVISQNQSSVKYDTNAKGEVDKNSLTLAGDQAKITTDSKGNQVVASGGTVIGNVGNGVKASDAVNKGQLDSVLSSSKEYTDSRINEVTGGLSESLNTVKEEITTVKGNVTNIQKGADGMFQVSQDKAVVKPKTTGANSLAGGNGAEASAKDSTALGNNSKATGKNSVALGNGSIADRDNTVSIGSVGNERQLTNVAAGTADTDAVNVQQLNNVSKSFNDRTEALNQRLDGMGEYVNKVDKRSSAGIAGVAAMANIPQVMAGGQKSFGIGIGNHRGENAVAIGGSISSNDGRWAFKTSASFDSQDKTTIGAGVSRVW
ncbi:YadA-like family protein, partial [Acinetobacter rudis]|uniref:YadA family autotransporter adhesin n=1 Tax=Acinetobacter rudis TaxID=632955 RepID=UPI00281085F4